MFFLHLFFQFISSWFEFNYFFLVFLNLCLYFLFSWRYNLRFLLFLVKFNQQLLNYLLVLRLFQFCLLLNSLQRILNQFDFGRNWSRSWWCSNFFDNLLLFFFFLYFLLNFCLKYRLSLLYLWFLLNDLFNFFLLFCFFGDLCSFFVFLKLSFDFIESLLSHVPILKVTCNEFSSLNVRIFLSFFLCYTSILFIFTLLHNIVIKWCC